MYDPPCVGLVVRLALLLCSRHKITTAESSLVRRTPFLNNEL